MFINCNVEVIRNARAAELHRHLRSEFRMKVKSIPKERLGLGKECAAKSSLKAHVSQRGLQNPITLANKLTFAHIMPQRPLAYFLGRA